MLKVVCPVWSKKWVRKWVIYSAMIFAWVSGIANNMATGFTTSAVVDGVCYGYAFWKDRTSEVAHAIWNFVSFYVVIMVIIVFCYWRILVTIRRTAGALATHGNHVSGAQPQSNQIQCGVQNFLHSPGMLVLVHVLIRKD